MSERSEKVKVHRTRKRVYEESPEDQPVIKKSRVKAPRGAKLAAVATQEAAAIDVALAAPPVEPENAEPEVRGNEETFRSAMTIVRKWSAMSAAVGLIPIPLLDVAGFMALQLQMLKKLSETYNIPFDSQRSKAAVAVLIGGINTAYLTGSASKMIPVFGIISIAAMPAVNGAISYAVGRVFIQHFASGGTFLNFDPAKVRDYFEEQCRQRKQS